MTFLEALADMVAAAGQGVLGQSLFVYQMPETAEIGIVLREPMSTPFNAYLPGYKVGAYQAIVRDRDYAAGTARAEALMKLLDFRARDVNLGAGKTLRINHSVPRHYPLVYTRAPNNLIEWSITFDLNTVEL